MATFADLEAQNPNIRKQLVEWRLLRLERNEDAFEYEAFRQHLIAIGAPDPGEKQIDDFNAD